MTSERNGEGTPGALRETTGDAREINGGEESVDKLIIVPFNPVNDSYGLVT